MIRFLDVKSHPGGMSKLTIVVDTPPSEFSEILKSVNDGKRYVCELKPFKKDKSKDQRSAIWAKIGEIAGAVGASKDEIYHICLRRYGTSVYLRVPQNQIKELENTYALVDVKQFREDGTAFVIVHKGLSAMDSAEAAKLLDGVLSECKEIGLKGEINA